VDVQYVQKTLFCTLDIGYPAIRNVMDLLDTQFWPLGTQFWHVPSGQNSVQVARKWFFWGANNKWWFIHL